MLGFTRRRRRRRRRSASHRAENRTSCALAGGAVDGAFDALDDRSPVNLWRGARHLWRHRPPRAQRMLIRVDLQPRRAPPLGVVVVVCRARRARLHRWLSLASRRRQSHRLAQHLAGRRRVLVRRQPARRRVVAGQLGRMQLDGGQKVLTHRLVAASELSELSIVGHGVMRAMAAEGGGRARALAHDQAALWRAHGHTTTEGAMLVYPAPSTTSTEDLRVM